MDCDADVIISGAGPAGSIAAYHLQKSGISTLILEKSAFPRYKVCGAGLTHKILSVIPFDLSPIVHTTIHSFRFSSGFKDVYTRTNKLPLMYCTMRDEFDAFLLEQAVNAGARVLTSEKVTGLSQDACGVYVKTVHGEYRSQFLIGADGASSLVARSFGLNNNIEWGMAWEAEVRSGPEILEKYSETVFLDWGTFPGGYAWIFPKKDHFSIGIGGPAHMARRMPGYYNDFIASCGIPILETISNRSHPLPVRSRKALCHSGRVLVAGDAAGLTDALTGEGIYWAVKSGTIAAGVIRERLEGKISDLALYSSRINSEIMPEMLEAKNICALFNAMPLRIHHWVRDSERVWMAFGKVLRGERSFNDVPLALGKWKPLWNPVCALCSLIRKQKEKKYMRNAR
ncbi:MAG: geranylgeranyl reductase family protein [Bacteroidetes bacterium]|nr:geranylgeranyl reductase family protein [Bacteroidota bacterium]